MRRCWKWKVDKDRQRKNKMERQMIRVNCVYERSGGMDTEGRKHDC